MTAERRVGITLVEQVESSMEKEILAGKLAVRGRLPGERLLARQLSVSRQTIREATTRLISRGVLYVARGRGTYVAHSGHVLTLDALIAAVLLRHGAGEKHPAFESLLELRRQTAAALLSLTAEHVGLSRDIERACDAVWGCAMLERDPQPISTLDFNLHAVAAEATGAAAFLHTLGSIQRSLDELPPEVHAHRSLSRVGERMERTAELLRARASEELRVFTLSQLRSEEAPLLAAWHPSDVRPEQHRHASAWPQR